MNTNHRLGIIGFGGMAEYHYNTAKRDDIAMPAAAAFDIRPERLERAKELGLRAYDNLEDFFADGGFDLVVVATSNNHHCRYVCRALEAGYNVMSEKPAAMNSVEIRQMIAASEKAGKFFTVHQNRRYDGDFRLMMKAAPDAGHPFVIESHCHAKNNAGCMYNWRGMTDHGGGMLLDWGVHMLDQLLWYIGKMPEKVFAVIRPVRSEEVDDYTKLVMTFDDGLTALMEVSTFAPIPMPRWMIYGERGAVKIDDFDSPAAHVRRIRDDRWHDEKAPAYDADSYGFRTQHLYDVSAFEEYEVDREGVNGDWGMIYKNLSAVLDGKAELFVKPQEVLNSMLVIEAAFRSARTGEAVTPERA